MLSSSVAGQTITKGKALDLNSIDTPNRKAFLCRQDSKEEHSAVLGKGAFGVVLQANYRSTPVAVKLVKRSDGGDDKLPQERNVIQVLHENIMRIIKIAQERHHFIIIMERLIGNNLQYILNHTEQIQLVHQMRIILQVATGLEFLHKNCIIHLDVKPANILICPPHLLVKLCDFGNSQRLKAPNKSLTLKNLSGTVAFMAPEMLKRNSVSTQSDVYALAITIWQLLHRKVPYSGMTDEQQVIYGVVKNNLRPSGEENASPSERLHADLCHWFHRRVSVSVVPGKEKNVDNTNPNELAHTLPTTDGLTWAAENNDSEDLEDNSEINWKEVFSVDQMKHPPPSSEFELLYQELYTKCWHRKPLQRPTITEVLQQLNGLLSLMP